MEIEPGNWTIPRDGSAALGLTSYKKFTVTNKAKDGADTLKINSIKLDDSSGQFKLYIDGCNPNFINDGTVCAQNECIFYSNNESFCILLPVSLPAEIKPGEKGIEFVVEYTPKTDGESPNAKIIINSNTENTKNEEFTDTDVRIQAAGGEAYIGISGVNVKPSGDKEFNFTAGKVEKGKSQTETIRMENTGDAELTFKLNWESEDKQFVVKTKDGKEAIGVDFKLGPAASGNNSVEFDITYTPGDCGSHEARLEVSSNATYKKLGETPDGVTFYSRSKLFIRMAGSSPTGAVPNPSTLTFDNVPVGSSKTLSFDLKVGDQGLCDVIVSGIKIAAPEGGTEPKFFSFGNITKDGNKVAEPTKAAPVTIKKGEVLKVEVVFAPTDKTVTNGVIILDTNDPTLDPKGTGVVNLLAGVERNDRPIARFRFYCDEDSSTACKKGDDLAGSIFLSNEKKVKTKLDASTSTDDKNDIKSYKWVLLSKPAQFFGDVSPSADGKTATLIVSNPGIYEVELTVTDGAGQEGKTKQQLNVQP